MVWHSCGLYFLQCNNWLHHTKKFLKLNIIPKLVKLMKGSKHNYFTLSKNKSFWITQSIFALFPLAFDISCNKVSNALKVRDSQSNHYVLTLTEWVEASQLIMKQCQKPETLDSQTRNALIELSLSFYAFKPLFSLSLSFYTSTLTINIKLTFFIVLLLM